ncbi:uncharacterized protein LOC116405242 [Cucumis sativus]|uniref:uncharacterized protein LOC116405242 n=1 Tax=Cucumis sativus TaxID=3659 RepID=UPI0012F4C971|nr:uncharacterized protein LOC116405242 [Cucumis sativus]
MTTPESSTSDSSNRSVPITSSNLDVQLNPFMLHHSITPTTNLVSTPLAGSNNYSSWSRAMMLALSGKNKVGFITGLIKKPSEDSSKPRFNGNIKEMWDELKERYKQSNGPHIYQLQKDLVTTTQGSLSVEIYYAKITTIWQELVEYRPMDECTCERSKKMVDFLNA